MGTIEAAAYLIIIALLAWYWIAKEAARTDKAIKRERNTARICEKLYQDLDRLRCDVQCQVEGRQEAQNHAVQLRVQLKALQDEAQRADQEEQRANALATRLELTERTVKTLRHKAARSEHWESLALREGIRANKAEQWYREEHQKRTRAEEICQKNWTRSETFRDLVEATLEALELREKAAAADLEQRHGDAPERQEDQGGQVQGPDDGPVREQGEGTEKPQEGRSGDPTPGR